MKSEDLYRHLDSDFEIVKLRDDWSFMDFNDFIFPQFKERQMGLVLDNAGEITKVYTATFPDLEIINKLIASGETDILLFSHHAMGYDGKVAGFPFYNIPVDILSKLKKQRISLYILHVPLDKNGEYSTSVNLAKNLRLEIIDEFCEYGGIKVGVICKTDFTRATELADYTEGVLGHKVKLRLYGNDRIDGGLVAVAAGGGSYGFVAEELAQLGIKMYITGFTRPLPDFAPTMEFHRIAQEQGINVLGATHYSTEKFACLAMTKYFKKLNLPADFIEGRYYLEDL